MRSPKMDALKKTRLMKDIVKDLSNKAIKCYRCGYVNGTTSAFLLDTFIMIRKNINLMVCLLFAIYCF